MLGLAWAKLVALLAQWPWAPLQTQLLMPFPSGSHLPFVCLWKGQSSPAIEGAKDSDLTAPHFNPSTQEAVAGGSS